MCASDKTWSKSQLWQWSAWLTGLGLAAIVVTALSRGHVGWAVLVVSAVLTLLCLACASGVKLWTTFTVSIIVLVAFLFANSSAGRDLTGGMDAWVLGALQALLFARGLAKDEGGKATFDRWFSGIAAIVVFGPVWTLLGHHWFPAACCTLVALALQAVVTYADHHSLKRVPI